jgi:DNA-directed RNA polymerase beta subunit
VSLNIIEDIKEIQERINEQEECFGKGLNIPFNPLNSGSRKIMFSIHREHAMPLLHPEVPIIGTGYEAEFGHNSSSFITTDDDYVVVDRVSKFSNLPNLHYWVILSNMKTNQLHVVERISYKHITESNGYLYDNKFLDSLRPTCVVPKGTVIKKSTGFDEYNNRMDGINLLTAYLSSDKSMEDGIVLSESAAKRFDSPLIHRVPIIINDNDILLNLYGDDMNYKTFPDIGEYIQDGILCSVRREKREERLFSQSYNRLRDIMMSDEKYTLSGQVVDINIYSNNPDALCDSYYNSQLKKYYDETYNMALQLVNVVEPLLDGHTMTHDLQKLYYNCKYILEKRPYMKDKKNFSNVIMEIVVMENIPIKKGDKLSNRYGGKGVVSEILPDRLMPKLASNGEIIGMQYNSSTCVNRENAGQLFEVSINHISRHILDFIYTGLVEIDEAFGLIYRFISLVSREQAEALKQTWDSLDNGDPFNDYHDILSDRMIFIDEICKDKGILLSLKPASESLDIDKLAAIYEEFPWIKQDEIESPIEDSNGNIRYVKARRPIICGQQYIYRLKQYAEEKYSATSLSATNIRNENSRSKANKVYKGLYTKTPIRFGEMETGDMAHLGMEAVVINLMLHSTSPHGRRLAEDLLTGNPFNVDIKLDEDSKNRGVEILNVYLKTMGLRLKFEKRYNNLKPLIHKPLVKKEAPLRPMIIKDLPEDFDPNAHFDMLLERDRPQGLRRLIHKRLIKKIER